MSEKDEPSALGLRWIAIANALHLRVVAPASIVLPSGRRIDADALLMNFGGPRGMLLVSRYDAVEAHRSAIVDAGYGFSVLGDPEPGGRDLVLADIVEVLRDWGWSGPADDEPSWLRAG